VGRVADSCERYEKRIGAVFVRRDCKKFEVEGEIVDRFQYRYAVFESKQGKKRHASTAKKRLNQRSFKTGCEARLSIIYHKTVRLEISQLQLTHNHKLDSNTRFVYPEDFMCHAFF